MKKLTLFALIASLLIPAAVSCGSGDSGNPADINEFLYAVVAASVIILKLKVLHDKIIARAKINVIMRLVSFICTSVI